MGCGVSNATKQVDEYPADAKKDRPIPLRTGRYSDDRTDWCSWYLFGGVALEPLLDHTALVDGRYLEALSVTGGRVQRRQETPAAELIIRQFVWKLYWWLAPMLPVLVISYPWLDKEHPDCGGETLQAMSKILKPMVDKARIFGGTVGVLWDYVSLHQRPFASEAEATMFKRALGSINEWYAHPHTPVLLMCGPLPTGIVHSSLRPYSDRGWCFFERQISSVAKDANCLWDATRFLESESSTLENIYKITGSTSGGLIAGRPPPMSPHRFSEVMRERVSNETLAFTAGSDMEMVIEQYRKGFVSAFDDFIDRSSSSTVVDGKFTIFLTHFGWGDDEGAVLAEALDYASAQCSFHGGSLHIDCFRGNHFSDATKLAIREAGRDKLLVLDDDAIDHCGSRLSVVRRRKSGEMM